jgi:hypothetical protein
MSSTEPPKADSPAPRPKGYIRISWGTIGAAAVAVISIVATSFLSGVFTPLGEQVGRGFANPEEGISSASPTPAACKEVTGDARGDVGEQAVAVAMRAVDDECWSDYLAGVEDGDEVELLVSYYNAAPAQANDVTLIGWLQPGLKLVPGTSKMYTSTTPDGAPISDNLIEPGVNIGSYATHANAAVIARVRVELPADAQCGVVGYGAGARLRNDTEWASTAVIVQTRCP